MTGMPSAAPGRRRSGRPARVQEMALRMRPGHRVALLTGGEACFSAMVEAIDAARFEVRLETYILDIGGSVVAVAAALERAAKRGVEVTVVYDGVGTGRLPEEWRRRWDDAGVAHAAFNPAAGWRLLLPRGWRRLHRKLAVIDRRIAFCGGINLLDDLHDPNHGPLDHPRLDFAVRVEGPLVDDAHDTVVRLWLRLKAARSAQSLDLEAAARAVRSAVRAGTDAGEPGRAAASASGRAPAVAFADGVHAELVLRDNVRFRRRIETTYRLAIAQAEREILIANAYFLPGVGLQRALLKAARRGVRVTLLLQGRYEYFMAWHASRAVYERLLRGGIRIVQYEASFLHAKVAVMDGPDGAIATVGSSNLDPLSLLLAREANVFVRDDGFADRMRGELIAAMRAHGRELEPRVHESRPLGVRLLDWVAFGLMRLALIATGRRY